VHLVLGEQPPEVPRLEPAAEHHAPAVIQRRKERYYRAVDVVYGQHAHHPVPRLHPVPLGYALGVDEQVVLVEYHALGRAGRAGRVYDKRLVGERRRVRRLEVRVAGFDFFSKIVESLERFFTNEHEVALLGALGSHGVDALRVLLAHERGLCA
jgi:hypothetical protein